MKGLLDRIQIQVNSTIYAKDPTSTDLGKKILKSSSVMINEIGFEAFTFKKLAKELSTTESSIYRYFTNKHNLLIYLLSWYWGYMEYIMVFSCANITKSEDKLKAAVNALCNTIVIPDSNDFIDEKSINDIIISESAKTWLTKSVDEENKEGFFLAFKQPCHRLAEIIEEINPKYKYSKSLASNVVEGICSQKYFSLHLQSLSDFDKNHTRLNDFYFNLVLKTIS